MGALLGWLERPLVVRDAFAELDAIVVLGAPLGPGGALTPAHAERVAAAAELYHRGGGRIVVATGGTTAAGPVATWRRGLGLARMSPRAESHAMAEALAAAGVPDVLVEDRSLTTADNARLTAELLVPLGVRRVWLVSQPFHGRRAARLFRGAGLEPSVWHIAGSTPRARSIAREYAAWSRLLLLRR